MTISYSRESNVVTLCHGTKKQSLPVNSFAALAQSRGWGDVHRLLECAQQNPGCTFPVDSEPSRVSRPRHATVHSILQ
jgi:hypothetical protein